MFKVNEYKIVFKRKWSRRLEDQYCAYIIGDGRYDTVCEIYVTQDKSVVGSGLELVYHKEPSFTGIARLHPNDCPDKIVGKKIALRKAFGPRKIFMPGSATEYYVEYASIEFNDKEVRTAIWKAFSVWVESWEIQSRKDKANNLAKQTS